MRSQSQDFFPKSMLQIYSAMSCYLNAPVCKQPNRNLPPASHIPPRQPDQIPDHPARPEIMLKPCFLDSRLKVLGVSCFHKFFSSTVFPHCQMLINAPSCDVLQVPMILRPLLLARDLPLAFHGSHSASRAPSCEPVGTVFL